MNFTSEVKVGLMAVLALTILASMVFVVGDISLFASTYSITIKYHHVDGLLVGSKVTMSGVKVGKVESIEIKSGVVYVAISIGEKYKLPKNANFTIDTMGLMGEKMVGIEIPAVNISKDFVKPGNTVNGVDPIRMTKLMSDGQVIMDRIKITTESINNIISDKKFADAIKNSAFSIEKAMATFSETAQNFDNRLDEVQGKVEKFLDHLDNMGYQATDLIDESRSSILESLENINGFTKDIKEVSEENKEILKIAFKNFQKASTSIAKLLKEIENGGLNAKEIAETLKNIRISTENMKQTTDEVKKIFEDGSVRKNVKESTYKINNVLTKADDLLGGNSSPLSAKMGYSTRYNTEQKTTSNDVDMKINLFNKELFMKVNNIGHGSELDFQIGLGKVIPKLPWLNTRFGVIESKMGIGFDYKWNKSLTMIDIIDTRNTKINSTTYYSFWENMDLLTKTEDVLNSEREYNLGIRYHF